MQTLIQLLSRISNWKTLLIFLALYLFFSGYILRNAELKINEFAGKEVGVIDLTFGFNPQKTLDLVAAYGDAGRAYYAKIEMTADLIYPWVYAFLFGIILTMIYRNKALNWVAILPFIDLIFDYLENVTIISLLSNYPQQSMTMATLCELFKLIKWMIVVVMVVLIVYGSINNLLKGRKRQKI